MAAAGVVERDVTDHPDAAFVGGGDQRRQRIVAAQEGVDVVERGRVVAMRGLRREERRQVDEVDTQALEMVEVLLDPGEVAAVQLVRADGVVLVDRCVPRCWDGPRRGRAVLTG